MKHVQVMIIGAGAAGLAAAKRVYEEGITDILVVERDQEYGGILNQCIHNGFGLHTFHEELSGPSYAYRCMEAMKNLPIEIRYNTTVMKIHEDKRVEIQSEKGYEIIACDAIILASGSRERSAGAIALKGSRSQGIYTAGCAQRYLNMDGILVGKKVFILGSGDIGLIMARRMSLEGAQVVGVAEIQPYSNGLARNIKQCLEDFNIPLYLSHTITAVHGRPRIQSVTLAQVDDQKRVIPGTEKEIEVDCLLLSVGLIPEITLLEMLPIEMDPSTKGIVVNEQYMSNLPGIFACGNALHVHDLVDFVSQEGNACGKACAQYLQSKTIHPSTIENKKGSGIGYVLPQHVSGQSDVEFYLRVNAVYKKAKIHIYGDGLDKYISKISLVPSEMVKVKLTEKELNQVHGDLMWEVVS